MIKKCAHCEINKPIESFTVHSRNKDGRHYLCKDCKSSYQKELREKYPDRYVKYRKTVNLENKRNYLFRYKHGFEREKAIELLKKQNGCEICKKDLLADNSQWNVDHDHQCCTQNKSCENCRRGILCSACNLLLGYAKDNIEILQEAIEYLDRYKNKEKLDGNT